jgi:DnaJ-class molecular chaperone
MQMRGADRHFQLKVSFLDAARGVTRRLTLPGGKTLDVKIPAGMEDGKQIRLKRQGEPGSGGAPAGDALIEVKVEPHGFLTRKGLDIHVELPVTLQEAVLGARVPVPTIDGIVQLTVPKHANSGTTLRLKGKGIHPAGESAGDQYVKLRVVLPDPPDPALDHFLTSWTPATASDVRSRLKLD